MNSSPQERRTTSVLPILVFGSAWGLIEMSLGGYLHLIHFPDKGALLGGIGFALMAWFTAMTRRPRLVPWLGLIAASFKLPDAVLLHASLLSPSVVNPAMAIIIEALAFRLVAAVFFPPESVRSREGMVRQNS